ncbi:MAG: heavy metal sensor histidine kinase [Deltaproteobacteria bacterium]|nr:heavy metal sensor histidine kinase [Deltaproteobacteria bacterium]
MKLKTLRGQLTLWYGGLLLGILACFGAVLYGVLARNLYRTVDQKLLALAEVVAESSVRNFLRPGFTNLSRLLEEFYGVPAAGQFIQVLDPSGNVGSRSPNLERKRLPLSPTALKLTVHGGRTVYETLNSGPSPLRVLTYPVIVRGHVRNVVQVATSLAAAADTLRQVLWILSAGIPTLLLLTLIGGWVLSARALRPLDSVVEALRALDAQHLDVRLPAEEGTQEVKELAENVNALLERLEDAFRKVTQFTADASHELRTPLTVLRGEAEVVLRHPRTSEEYQAVIASSLEEIHRMGRIVEDLLLLAKGDLGEAPIEKMPVSLDALLQEMAAHAEMLAEAQGLTFTLAEGPPVTISADPIKLRQLFWNLLDNAMKYTPPGGRVFLSHTRPEPGWVRVTVKDTGVGIPAEDQERIFERFYRVDKHRARAQGGSGLGLAICRWIASAHGGRIEVRSKPGVGSSFLVYLPLDAAS